MAWTGFTDEQLNALKRQNSDEAEKQPIREGRPQGRPAQRGRGRSDGSRGRGRAGPPQSMRQEPVSQDQMLSKPKHQGPRGGRPVSSAEHNVWNDLNEPSQRRPPPARRKATPQGTDTPQRKEEDRTKEGQKDRSKGERMGPEPVVEDIKKESSEIEKEEEKVKILNEDEGQERESSKLEEFQRKQRQMEEENAKKKNLLARAIADRKKKTQAEAKRLLYIQKELAKIENLLTNDVSILRDKIEESSRDFNEAQRRYEKAEAEFVAAKIHLHKKTEMKEALTEHLCTIIHENELRKSRKLEELVSKLDVDNLEEFDIPEQTPPTSPVPQSVPHQADSTKNPSEDNGMAQVSSNNSSDLPTPQGDSTIPQGVSSDKLTSTAQSEASTPSSSDKQTERLTSDKTGKSEGKADAKITDPTVTEVKSDIKDDKSVISNECEQSNDQPEAEQHVELTADQT